MSYDLAVFDPAVAPRDRDAFLAWFHSAMDQDVSRRYDDPAVCTPALRSWFLEIVKEFAALNGPYAPPGLPDDVSEAADYSIDTALIYVGFRWSRAEAAYEATFRLAEKNGVGFFNVSSDTSDVWLPGPNGKLLMAHSD